VVEFVLVLSIAVLVLVLDSILRDPGGSLNQSSQHQYDSFQISFAMAIRIILNRIANPQHVMNRRKFQGRPASDLTKTVLVLETLLSIALGDVQRNRLSRTQPLITSMSIRPAKRLGDRIRKRHVNDREPINLESFMIASWFCHHDPFEYEYEYRCTVYEYEYDCPDELCDGRPMWWRPSSET